MNDLTLQKEQAAQKTILIIEDDASVGASLIDVITQETSCMAFLVTESEHALRVLEDMKPDLIVLDYLLPQMNGLDLYDYLDAHKTLAGIPVIMISANLPQKEVEKRHLIGLQKPFELDDLLATIHTALSDQQP